MRLNAVFCGIAASGLAPMARKMAVILACVPMTLSAATTLPKAGDLATDATDMRKHGKPMVILYSRADCSWCDQARRYLVPMSTARESRDLAIFRQVDIDTQTAMTDFAGRRSNHGAFARTQKASLTPTVVLYDADGRELGDPIIGMRLPDFYGQYLNNAIMDARKRLESR